MNAQAHHNLVLAMRYLETYHPHCKTHPQAIYDASQATNVSTMEIADEVKKRKSYRRLY